MGSQDSRVFSALPLGVCFQIALLPCFQFGVSTKTMPAVSEPWLKGLWKVNQCRAWSLERTGPLCVSLGFQGSPQHRGLLCLVDLGLKSQVCVDLMERVGQDFSLCLEALMSCVQKPLEDTCRHILTH